MGNPNKRKDGNTDDICRTIINISMTMAERDILGKKANKAGKTIGAWLRDLGLNTPE